MEVLNKFGFEPILFLAQVVNFIIIFVVMKKFLYAPLLKILNERKNKIDEGLKQSEQANKLLQQTLEKEGDILKKAQFEAKRIIDDAKRRHDAIIAESEDAAKKRVEKMISDAKNQINQETLDAQKRLAGKVSDIAAQMLTKSLLGFFDPKDQEKLVKQAISRLKKKAD